jgi:hypothetical protein
MARSVARIRKLPTREAVERRKLAADLAAQQYALPDEVVDQLRPEVRQARANYLRALRRQARDEDEVVWPGGYDMFSRRQIAYIRKALRALGPQDRKQNVYDAFLLLIGNIDRDTGEITLSRKEFADELGIQTRHVSSVMTTLERLEVVRREYEGNRVTYFVNANVAWNGDLDLRKVEAAKSRKPSEIEEQPAPAPAPLLKLMQGGLVDPPDQSEQPAQALPKPRPGGGRAGRKKAGA